MAELSWQPVTPLARDLVPGRFGAAGREAGVHIVEYSGFEVVQVTARRGKWAALVSAAGARFGAAPPAGPGTAGSGGVTLIWSGPDEFLVLGARLPDGALLDALAEAFPGSAAVTDQSDGRALLRLWGPDTRRAFAKSCSLDLDAGSFPAGMAAVTSIDHTPVNLWRGKEDVGDLPVFFLLLPASYSASLLGTIMEAAAEYGIEAHAAEPWRSEGETTPRASSLQR